MTVETARRLLTVQEFYRMCETGILLPEERLELANGEIITMAPIGSAHHWCVMQLTRVLGALIGDRAWVSVQGPLAIGPHDLRYPDLAILRPRGGTYRASGPSALDALLVIEVADTTVTYDREVKVPLYAAAGIPEAWLLDLPAARLEVYRDPVEGAYRQTRRLSREESIAVEAFPDVTLQLADLLG